MHRLLVSSYVLIWSGNTLGIKTLDSIHLVSALATGSTTVVVSHDDNVKKVAALLGLSSPDPLAEPDPAR